MTGSINVLKTVDFVRVWDEAINATGVTIPRYFPKTTEVRAHDGARGVDTAEIVLMLCRGDENHDHVPA